MKSLYPVHPVIPSKKDKETEMEHEAVTEKIIGCAYRVYNTMGFGYMKDTACAIVFGIVCCVRNYLFGLFHHPRLIVLVEYTVTLTKAIDSGYVHKRTQVSLENNTIESVENALDCVFEIRYYHVHAPSVLSIGLW